MLNRLRTYTRLGRWLGPWASNDHAPDVIRERRVVVPTNAALDSVEVWRFRPLEAHPRGTWIIAPGLHFAGPADPRFERFAKILAHAGFDVWAPFIPEYLALRITPRAFDHFRMVFDAAQNAPGRAGKVAVFSISFGSLMAFELAAHPSTREQVASLVVFGGYGHFVDTATFCMTGVVNDTKASAHDPLNLPVLFIHAVDHLVDAPTDREVLVSVWRRYLAATWGIESMKHDRRYVVEAERLVDEVPEHLREMFLIGCGVTEGGPRLIDPVLRGPDFEHLDPGPYFADIQCPVHLFHGVDDDVIPHQQLGVLDASLRPHTQVHTYLTGLYGHTRNDQGTGMGGFSDAFGELVTMARMLDTLALRGTTPHRT